RPPITPCFLTRPRPPPGSTLFPYTTLFRSRDEPHAERRRGERARRDRRRRRGPALREPDIPQPADLDPVRHCRLLVYQHVEESRSEEHTSELQSRSDLVCRLLLEKKKKKGI